MDIRNSFSRLKKKFKHPRRKGNPDRIEVDSSGETDDPAGSLSRPVSHVVAGEGHNQEDNRIDVDRRQSCSTDKPPPPDMSEQVPAPGGGDDQEGERGSVDGWEASRESSRPHSDVEVATGSGLGQDGAGGEEVGLVHSSPSTPSIPHNRQPDGST